MRKPIQHEADSLRGAHPGELVPAEVVVHAPDHGKVHGEHATNGAGSDQLARPRRVDPKTKGVPHGQHCSVPRGRADHPITVFQGGCHRLLHQDVLPGCKGEQGITGMHLVRGCHDDGIDVRSMRELFQRGMAIHPEAGGKVRRPTAAPDGDQLRRRAQPANRLGMRAGHVTGTGDANSEDRAHHGLKVGRGGSAVNLRRVLCPGCAERNAVTPRACYSIVLREISRSGRQGSVRSRAGTVTPGEVQQTPASILDRADPRDLTRRASRRVRALTAACIVSSLCPGIVGLDV